MSTTDPIADMLSRIRNANLAMHEKVEMPASRTKEAICRVLKEEGFIKNYRRVDDRKQGVLRIYLKYGPNQERVINGLKRLSKPSLRRYTGKKNLPRIVGGVGICIVSTSRGLMTDKQARDLGIGGEIMCAVW
jgi:small subunit ribosomal protein S8